MTCTIRFLCALRSEQWEEDNVDPSGNRVKFTKYSGTAGCCCTAWNCEQFTQTFLICPGRDCLVTEALFPRIPSEKYQWDDTDMKKWRENVQTHEQNFILSLHSSASRPSRTEIGFCLYLGFVFFEAQMKTTAWIFEGLLFSFFFPFLCESFNYSPKFCSQFHFTLCSSSRALYSVVVLGVTSP